MQPPHQPPSNPLRNTALSGRLLSADNVASDPKGGEAEEVRAGQRQADDPPQSGLAGPTLFARRLAAMPADAAASWVAESRPKLQAKVAELRAKHLKGGKLRDETRASYAADAARVAAAGGDPRSLAGTPSSFRKLRAACKWAAREDLRLALLDADRHRKSSGNDIMALCVYASELPRLEARLLELDAMTLDDAKLARRDSSHGQRRKLGRLPADWVLRLHRRAAGGKYEMAVAVGALVPIRPAEIAKGVVIKLTRSGLVFEIEGAKVQERGSGLAAGVSGIGQERRGVRVDAVDAGRKEVFQWLMLRVAASGGELTIGADLSAASICSAFSSMSRREFPRLSSPPSFYALRHAACAELKASGLSAQDIAKAMGHASEESAQAYGTASQGSGGWAVRAVSSGPVRPAKPKPKPPSRRSGAPLVGRQFKPKAP